MNNPLMSLLKKAAASIVTAGTQYLTSSNLWGSTSRSGVTVDEIRALNVVTVYACVRILSETLASLPLILYERLPRGKNRAQSHPLYKILHDSPNPDMNSFTFRETLMAHLVTWGNAYAEIEWETNMVDVKHLWPLRPDCMQVLRVDGVVQYKYTLPSGAGYITLPPSRVFHVPGMGFDGLIGYAPITFAREAIGLALATEEFGARFFGNGAASGGVLEHPAHLSKEAQDNLRKSWNDMHQGLSNQHRIAILEEGMKFSKTSIPPDDAQFLETRKFQRNEIASFFHIPPHMIGDLERATFSNIEEQALEFVVYTMRPWLIRWEQAINTKLLNPLDEGQYFSEFLVDGLLRGNQQARFTSYATGRQWGWLSANDIRELENQNPLPGEEGNIYLNPLNMVPALQLLQPNNNQGKGGTSGTQIN